MQKNIIFKLLLLSLLVISCNSQNSVKNNDGIIVDLDSKEVISIFDLFSKVEIIPLETKKGAIIDYDGSSNHFTLKNDSLYYFSKKLQDVTLFNINNGLFIKRLNYLGNGPGEYSALSDFRINEFNNSFDFLTPQGKLLMYNNYDTNEFIDKTYIPVRAVHGFLPISKDSYICSVNTDVKPLFIFDKSEGEIKELDYSLPEHILYTPYGIRSMPYYFYSDSIMFRESFSGNIYTVDTVSGKLKERFIWNFLEHQFSLSCIPKDIDGVKDYKLFMQTSMNYASQFAKPAENDKYIIMPFYYKNNGWVLIYDKATKTARGFSEFKEGVHLDRGVIHDNAYYVITKPSILKLFVNSSILDFKCQEAFSNITDENNLIVIKYYFK